MLNVSGGTAVMKDRDGYRKVPKAWIQGWGQGLALAFLAAILKTPSAGSQPIQAENPGTTWAGEGQTSKDENM